MIIEETSRPPSWSREAKGSSMRYNSCSSNNHLAIANLLSCPIDKSEEALSLYSKRPTSFKEDMMFSSLELKTEWENLKFSTTVKLFLRANWWPW